MNKNDHLLEVLLLFLDRFTLKKHIFKQSVIFLNKLYFIQ